MKDMIRFKLDGRDVAAHPGETIWQAARREGTEIPHLCYSPEPGYRPDGNCRACMVEVEGERVLAASCLRKQRHGGQQPVRPGGEGPPRRVRTAAG
jgi:formate dehydrogenase major subunit